MTDVAHVLLQDATLLPHQRVLKGNMGVRSGEAGGRRVVRRMIWVMCWG